MENNINEQEVVVEETAPVEEAAPEAAKKFDYEAIVDKIVTFFKTTDPKKLIKIGCLALAAVLVIVAGGLVISALNNNYKTPVKIMQKYDNTFSKDPYAESIASLNGLFTKEAKAIIKIMKSTEDYKDNLEDYKDYIDERKEELADEYGKNWKVTYKIEDKERLDKDDVKDFKKQIREAGDNLVEQMDEMLEDYDSDDWEDAGEDVGLSKSKMKDLAKKTRAYGKLLKKVKVTDGYTLTVVVTTTGSELDEPIESEREITVYKVNGRWVTASALYSFMNAM